MKYNVGIFGISGFIGSHLFNSLSQYYSVKGFSSTATGARYDSRVDIDLFTKNLDVAIYSAGAINPRLSTTVESRNIIEVSVKDFETCLEIFFLNNPNGLFVFFSSAGALYPNSFTEFFNEKSSVSPLGFYGDLKYKQELLLANKFSNNNIIILRPSNVFGDPFKKNKTTGVIDKLILSAIRGDVVDIFENLNSERDYLYIDDLQSAVLEILKTDALRKNIGVVTYNLSSHEIIKLNEIIIKIGEHFPVSKSKICYTGIDKLSNRLKIDSAKLRRETGWAPAYNFEKALIKMKNS